MYSVCISLPDTRCKSSPSPKSVTLFSYKSILVALTTSYINPTTAPASSYNTSPFENLVVASTVLTVICVVSSALIAPSTNTPLATGFCVLETKNFFSCIAFIVLPVDCGDTDVE